MGYTHYWYLNKKSEGANGIDEPTRFGEAIIDMEKIVSASRVLLAGWDGEGDPEVSVDEISFNGIGDAGHETFTFQRFGTQEERLAPLGAEDKEKDFAFCKTAQKPYDVVVVACLAVAAQVIGDGIEVSTDGESKDWEEGVAFASRILGRDVPVPGLNK